jgi:hypothetical protein
MSSEDPNNTPHWRNKLDELEHLPDASFNRDAAWDNLQSRLEGNKRSKKISWYWIAAACLVFGLMIALLNYHKGSSEPANKETIVKQQPTEIKKPISPAEQIDQNEIDETAERIKDRIVSTPIKPVQKIRRIITMEVAPKVRPEDVAISYPQNEPVAKSLQIVKNSTTAVAPPKKKLNVVHINELGDPVIESPDVTRIQDIHSFKLKFGNGEVFSNSPSKPPGFIILKTKTASN